jgi:hypothetical protein
MKQAWRMKGHNEDNEEVNDVDNNSMGLETSLGTVKDKRSLVRKQRCYEYRKTAALARQMIGDNGSNVALPQTSNICTDKRRNNGGREVAREYAAEKQWWQWLTMADRNF